MRLGRVAGVAALPDRVTPLDRVADLDADAALLQVREDGDLVLAMTDQHRVSERGVLVHRAGRIVLHP